MIFLAPPIVGAIAFLLFQGLSREQKPALQITSWLSSMHIYLHLPCFAGVLRLFVMIDCLKSSLKPIVCLFTDSTVLLLMRSHEPPGPEPLKQLDLPSIGYTRSFALSLYSFTSQLRCFFPTSHGATCLNLTPRAISPIGYQNEDLQTHRANMGSLDGSPPLMSRHAFELNPYQG